MSGIVPPWLPQPAQANPAQGAQPQQQVLAAPRVASARSRAVGTPVQAPDSYGFAIPPMWAYDGCKRGEPVLDHDHKPARVVRRIGWLCCIRCARPFFSADVVAVRMCSACK